MHFVINPHIRFLLNHFIFLKTYVRISKRQCTAFYYCSSTKMTYDFVCVCVSKEII